MNYCGLRLYSKCEHLRSNDICRIDKQMRTWTTGLQASESIISPIISILLHQLTHIKWNPAINQCSSHAYIHPHLNWRNGVKARREQRRSEAMNIYMASSYLNWFPSCMGQKFSKQRTLWDVSSDCMWESAVMLADFRVSWSFVQLLVGEYSWLIVCKVSGMWRCGQERGGPSLDLGSGAVRGKQKGGDVWSSRS